LLAALVTLTACQGIPATGPVTKGLSNLNTGDEEVIYEPNAPVPEMSQEDIVLGFLQAGSSSKDDYAIARKFLTPAYSSDWTPSNGVIVDDGTREPVADGGGTVTVAVQALSFVDDRGSMRIAEPGGSVPLRFELEQVSGEWRIAAASTEIVLDRSTFTTLYGQHNIYFQAPATGALVPDARWFPTRATTSTNIVTELLAGPAEPLDQGVLTSGFPSGTTLVAESVPVVNNRAHIDLSVEALAADAQATELIRKQLAASLQSVSGVSEFLLTVDQSAFNEGDVILDSRSRYPKVQNTSLVMREDTIGEYNGTSIRPIGELGELIVAQKPDAVSLSFDGETAAILKGGVVSLLDDFGVHAVDDREKLIAPSIDQQGYVWTVPAGAPNEIHATLLGTAQLQLTGSWIAGGEIRALRISRDGSRAAALLDVGKKSVVSLAGVLRDEAGNPTGFSEAVQIASFDGEAIDLDWIDEGRVAVALAGDGNGGGGSRVAIAGLGLFPSESPIAKNIVSVAGANSRSQLRILDDTGALYAPRGSTWSEYYEGVQLLVKRG
ncbi:LpqB family beta-propeller domain-containing protein, partial [Leucobacter sp. M11]|uniref:LpqB family beta-propeller domain-containing protein n=1 Tax=Leucobacter sp. M11 TaxID=2993565 RepID=UPI002D7EFFE9